MSTAAHRFRERGVLAAPISIGLLLLSIGTVVAWALANEHAVATGPAPRVRTATTALDPLTGRAVDTGGRPLTPRSGWGSADRPIRLTFVPSGDQAQASVAVDGMCRWLEARTGFAIEGAILRSYGLVVTQIASGECEVAFLTAASYGRARYLTEANDTQADDIEAVLSAVRQSHPDHPGSDLAYRGAILVAADSDLERVDQLDASRSIAMGGPMSGAGSILPGALLNELGLAPRIQRFTGGYPFIVNAVIEGKVDAGCIWWSPPTAELSENDARITIRNTIPDVFEKTRIIGYTRWIPNEPVVVRKALPEGIKRALARAIDLYVSSKALTPEGRSELHSVGSVVGYVPATNADYDILMDAIERAFANDPEGLADFKRGGS